MFTERPERLIGSAALASLLGGVPLALIFSVWGAIEGGMSISPLHFVGWAFGIAGICFAFDWRGSQWKVFLGILAAIILGGFWSVISNFF